MNDITFTGILGWFIGIIFILIVLILAGLFAIEMIWRFLAKRSKKKMLKRWADKYEVKQ